MVLRGAARDETASNEFLTSHGRLSLNWLSQPRGQAQAGRAGRAAHDRHSVRQACGIKSCSIVVIIWLQMCNFHRASDKWRVAAIVVLAGCGAVCLSAQGDETQGCATRGEYAPVVVGNPGSKVTFKCDRTTPLDLVRAVGRQARIPIGVVLGEDPSGLSKSIRSFDLEKVDARFALLKAIEDTGYSLKEENQVIVLIAGDLTPRQRSLLAHRYSGLKPGPSKTMIELGFDLTMWMRAAIDPSKGFGASISTSANEEQFTLEGISAATTEEIADKIVSLGSKGMWIFRTNASPTSGALTDQVVIEPYQHYSNRPNADR